MELSQDFRYSSTRLSTTLTVPRGFDTDLATIPRVLWVVLPKVGRWDRAAVIHDWLYTTGEYTRAQSDAVLYEAMNLDRVPWSRRWIIYLGVRIGGQTAWFEHGQMRLRASIAPI